MVFPSYPFAEQSSPQQFRCSYNYEDTKPAIHLELDMSAVQPFQDEPSPNLMQALQPPRPFTADLPFLPNFSSSNSLQLFEDYSPTSPIHWDCPNTDHNDSFADIHSIHGPFASSDSGYSPETFLSSSPLHHPNHLLRHHASFPSEHTYTRMFRGRKSKSAAEVSSSSAEHVSIKPPFRPVSVLLRK